MCHRIREAMRAGDLGPLGGEGEIVEADETYFGPVERRASPSNEERLTLQGRRCGPANKRAIVALVERGGNLRSLHVAIADQTTVEKIMMENIAKEARLFTDESRSIPMPPMLCGA